MRVQSSIKKTNHQAYLGVGIFARPHTFERTSIKGFVACVMLMENRTQCPFANSDMSHLKSTSLRFVNNAGNNFLKYLNDACPYLNQMLAFCFSIVFALP